MNLRSAATFPCNADKSPISQRGFKDAMRGVEWRKAPLVGFPTGAVNGLDVLDIDGDAGRQWYDANYDAIPATRAHATRRGMHLLFRRAPGLRCTESKIAEGVDVRAEGGYVIWWPREGLPIEDAPISEWPDWLREEARAAHRSKGDRHSNLSVGVLGMEGVVEGILGELDPAQFRDHDHWLKLMMSCHAAGIDRETFIRWSTADPEYSGDGEIIRRRWDSLRADGGVSAAILLTEVRRAQRAKTEIEVAVPLRAPPTFQPSLNRESRFINLIERLKNDGREDLLFWTSCELAGMVLIEGWPREHVARGMLEEASRINGLRASLGAAGCKQTIDHAFAHVASKLKEPQS